LCKRVEAHAQRLDLLLLPEHDIAQFAVRPLEKRHARLDPLNVIAVHFDSLAISRAPRLRDRERGGNRNQTAGIPVPNASPGTRSRDLFVTFDDGQMPCFQGFFDKQNISIKLDASPAGDVFTCCDRATRVRFKTFGLLRGKS
jgi:hypothetical protein